MVQHAAGVTKLESQMSLPPLNQNISNLWKSHVSQPASVALKNLSEKFDDFIARLTEIISKRIKGNNENNLGSPKVQKDLAVELAGGFFKYKSFTPELTPKDWSLMVEVTLEQHPGLRGKTENNIQQVMKAVSSLIGNPAFRRDVENQLELDQKKSIENLRLEPEVASPQPREPEFTIDLGNSSDVTAISRTIVRSWLQAEAVNPDKSLSEFFGQWSKHLQSKENIINSTVENLDNIIEESMSLLNEYYRNVEIEKLKNELVEYICIATGFDDNNQFPEDSFNKKEVNLSVSVDDMDGDDDYSFEEKEEVLEDSFDFSDPVLQKKYEEAQRRLVMLELEQKELESLNLVSLKF